MMIVFEDEHGLTFWPEELVISLTPAFPNRLRVVTADGTVGYAPAGPQPFVRARLDPAGFDHGDTTLTPTPEYTREAWWGLEATPQGLQWLGDDGPSLCSLPLEEASRGLCRFAEHRYFQPRRLRRLTREELILDDGRRIPVSPRRMTAVWQFLGISSLQLQPESLTRIFLREYPFEIARAPAEVLRRHFPTPAKLIANLIWQALYFYQLGQDRNYGRSHRGFWYNPLAAALERCGHINSPQPKEILERLFHRTLAQMVDEDRLFCFRDLNFEDLHASEREIGTRPEIVLLIEKKDLSSLGIQAARHFGISWIITGGVSRIAAAEFFCAALRHVYSGPIRILVYGDFDPGGRVAGTSLTDHLARFGVACPKGPEFLITPDLFTPEELDLFSRPLTQADGRVDEFVAQTGGIHGQPRGIHADWLRPLNRVIEVVHRALQG